MTTTETNHASSVVLPDNPVWLGKFTWGIDNCSGKHLLLCEADASPLSKKSRKVLDMFANLDPRDCLIVFARPFLMDGRTFLRSPFRMDLGNCAHLLISSYTDGFPESSLWLISKSILQALSYLHSQRIIHRAVCAANIWLDSSGQIRLALTRHAIRIDDCPKWIGVRDRVQDFSSDLEDMVAWLAPEVLMQDLNGYGVESDLYSLGISICELGNGVAPFQEMEPLRILFEKLSGSIPVLLDSVICTEESREETRTFSKELHDFVGELLEQNRPTAVEFLRKYESSFFSEHLIPGKEALSFHLPLAKKHIS